ncbi:two-component system, chemotaxis family, response regulator CheY [Lachnospiraceae bacterium]|nr:two-component system, chemotaxis family, response regulator CheY [Lachnospiraceae bacterium]
MGFENLKVLICDDSLLARKNLRDGLKILGCTDITEVYDGQAAVDSYKKTNYDVVFLDIVMPVMDGITAAREICTADTNAYIVMVSSVGTQVHLREAIKAGARDFLQKPATPEQIRTALEHVTGGEDA